MILDELSNLTRFLGGSYATTVHLFPTALYNDRPVGFAFARLLYDLFGLDYTKQVACQLVIHFANCVLGFALFRRLGVSVALSLAAIGLYGSFSTTVLTATYIGAVFDVLCLFFLLGSTLSILSDRRGSATLSALLFLAALRSKEFAIVTPALLTVLVALRLPRLSLVCQRLWIHYLILIVFGIAYLRLLPGYLASSASSSPYHMDFRIGTILQSLGYYTSQILGLRSDLPAWPLAGLFVAIFVWAVVRRRGGIAFGIAGFVLTLLPVLVLPNSRQPYWLYAPQLFFLLAVCLVLEALLIRFLQRDRLPWAVAICIALLCLTAATRFRRSPVLWHLSVRKACMRTVTDARSQLADLGPGTHIYVNSGRQTPWLFVPGPCDYFKLVNRQRSIFCVIDKPAEQLQALYKGDTGPKYLVDYREDGSIATTPRLTTTQSW